MKVILYDIIWNLEAVPSARQRINFTDDPVISNGVVRHIVWPGRNVLSRYTTRLGNYPTLPAGNIGNAYLNLYEKDSEIIRCENLPLNFIAIPDTVNINAGQPGGRLINFNFKIDLSRSYIMANPNILALRPTQVIPLLFFVED